MTIRPSQSAGPLLIAVACTATVALYLYGVRDVDGVARWLPLGVGLVTVALCAWDVLQESVRLRHAGGSGSDVRASERSDPARAWRWPDTTQFLWAATPIVTTLVAGVVLGTSLFVAAYLFFLTKTRIRTALVMATAFGLVSYQLFVAILRIDLFGGSLFL